MILPDDLDLPFRHYPYPRSQADSAVSAVYRPFWRNWHERHSPHETRHRSPARRMDPADYVLQNFSRDDLKSLSELLDRAADAALEFVVNGLNAAMNKFPRRRRLETR
ncbi:MAG: hypothetical protein U0V48_04950 [Anaerolineales bacterium]